MINFCLFNPIQIPCPAPYFYILLSRRNCSSSSYLLSLLFICSNCSAEFSLTLDKALEQFITWFLSSFAVFKVFTVLLCECCLKLCSSCFDIYRMLIHSSRVSFSVDQIFLLLKQFLLLCCSPLLHCFTPSLHVLVLVPHTRLLIRVAWELRNVLQNANCKLDFPRLDFASAATWPASSAEARRVPHSQSSRSAAPSVLHFLRPSFADWAQNVSLLRCCFLWCRLCLHSTCCTHKCPLHDITRHGCNALSHLLLFTRLLA